MNPTHADIIKQQVERFNQMFPLPTFLALSGGKGVERDRMISFLTTAMHAAAHATEKAGEVEESILDEKILPYEKHEASYHEADGWNGAIAKSRRQLDEYFGRTITG